MDFRKNITFTFSSLIIEKR